MISRGKKSKINLKDPETPAQQIKKFPKDLASTFIKCVLNDWNEELYELFVVEERKYLGSKFEDRLEQGRLVVLLSKATSDITKEAKNEKKKQKTKAKKTEEPASHFSLVQESRTDERQEEREVGKEMQTMETKEER